MSTQIISRTNVSNIPFDMEAYKSLEDVVLHGDLSRLSSKDKVMYYHKVCESIGLNPFTKPFEYIRLNGKEVLYAKKDAAEQLRKNNNISIEIKSRETVGDVYIVVASARDQEGRTDESLGAINLTGLKGDALANAFMKAETKAKRRVTLSISGLGFLDESEIETIKDAVKVEPLISEEDLVMIKDKMKEADSEEINICQHFKIESIESMTFYDFSIAMRMLQRKIDKKRAVDDLEINQLFTQEKE
jgi:hypothetical protein